MATLKEALESGKKHRLVGMKEWMPAYFPSPTSSGEIYWGKQVLEEWEIYETTVEVTRAKLAEACADASRKSKNGDSFLKTWFECLAEELGL